MGLNIAESIKNAYKLVRLIYLIKPLKI